MMSCSATTPFSTVTHSELTLPPNPTPTPTPTPTPNHLTTLNPTLILTLTLTLTLTRLRPRRRPLVPAVAVEGGSRAEPRSQEPRPRSPRGLEAWGRGDHPAGGDSARGYRQHVGYLPSELPPRDQPRLCTVRAAGSSARRGPAPALPRAASHHTSGHVCITGTLSTRSRDRRRSHGRSSLGSRWTLTWPEPELSRQPSARQRGGNS